MMIRVQPRAAGAYLLSWRSPSDAQPSGDALLVDARRAEISWCALADILIHPCPVPDRSAASVVQTLLSHNTSAVMLVSLGSNRWAVRSPDGQMVTIELPGRELPVAGAALVYCWVLRGRPLSSMPSAIGAQLSTPGSPDVLA